MTPENTPEVVETTAPEPVVTASGEGVAENYVLDELQKARITLKKVQLTSAIGLFALAAYLGAITFKITQYAQPDVAAQVTTGLISQRVEEQGPEIAQKFKDRIPEFVSSIPGHVKQQLPQAREQLLNQIEADLTNYSNQHSQELGKNLDAFLETHKDQLKTIMDVGQDRQSLKAIAPEIDKELTTYLQAPQNGGGDSLQAKIDQSLIMLKQMRAKTDHLARNKGLTPEEKKTRTAIALIARSVKKNLNGVDVRKAVLDHVDTNTPPEAQS